MLYIQFTWIKAYEMFIKIIKFKWASWEEQIHGFGSALLSLHLPFILLVSIYLRYFESKYDFRVWSLICVTSVPFGAGRVNKSHPSSPLSASHRRARRSARSLHTKLAALRAAAATFAESLLTPQTCRTIAEVKKKKKKKPVTVAPSLEPHRHTVGFEGSPSRLPSSSSPSGSRSFGSAWRWIRSKKKNPPLPPPSLLMNRASNAGDRGDPLIIIFISSVSRWQIFLEF